VKRTGPLAVDPKLLASPLRAEIIGHLQTEGPLSIRQLATHLSRPANGLYHHVSLLAKAGLLLEKERRRSGRREEAVYALAAPRAAGGGARDPAGRSGIAAAAKTALRMAEREFASALDACPPRRRPGPRLSRQRVWLDDAAREKVLELLARLEALLARENRRRRGRLHVVTTVVVPVMKR
jgi:DNA-binding transcriptional ArsR family regulator